MATPAFVKSVVNTCLRIRKEDRVCIFTWRHTLDLAEAFAFECKNAGAKIHLEVETDRLYYQTALDLPVDYIREGNPFSLSLLDIATANIFIVGPEDPMGLRKITPERMSALVEGDKPYMHKFLEKRIRSAHVYLGYVTRQRAKTYGFDYEEWNKNVQAALDVDYDAMRELGGKIGRMMEESSVAHITADNGTDLTLELGKGMAIINDGIVDDEDIRKGAAFTSLPAGSVTMPLKERSADGVFVADLPEADSGLLIHGMAWKFKKGRLTSFNGEKNIELVRNRWEIAKGDRDQASWFTVGINPHAKGEFLRHDILLGSFTLGIGDNREFGGKIESDFGAMCTNSKPSLELDGRFVIRNGKLTL